MFRIINEAFHVKGKPILYAWGTKIYNPMGVEIAPEMMAHEEIHGIRQRQQGNLTTWWLDYTNDPEFRLAEEIPAHQAEYQHIIAGATSRNYRRAALKHVAKKLAAPLYGQLISVEQAKKELKR